MSNWQCKMDFDLTISPRSGELDAPHIVYLNITCGQVLRRLATQTRLRNVTLFPFSEALVWGRLRNFSCTALRPLHAPLLFVLRVYESSERKD